MIHLKKNQTFEVRKRVGSRVDGHTFQLIASLYEGGKSIVEIGKELELNPKTVLYHLKNYPREIHFRHSGGNSRVRRLMKTIILRYQSGKESLRKLGREYGIHDETIARNLRKRGIKVIPRANQFV